MLTGTHWPPAVKITVGSILGLLAIGLLIVFRAMIAPTVVACLVVFILNIPVEGLERRDLPRSIAAVIVYVLLIGLVALLWLVLGPWIQRFLVELQSDLDALLRSINTSTVPWMESISLPLVGDVEFLSGDLITRFNQEIQTVIVNGLGSLTTYLGNLTSGLLSIIYVIVLSFWMLKDWNRLKAVFARAIPDPWRSEAIELASELDRIWMAFLRGQVLLGLVVGCTVFMALVIVGVPNARALAVIAGVLEFLPIVGPIASGVVGVTVALISGSNWLDMPHLWFAALVAGLYIVIGQVESIYFIPRFIGRRVHLHPAVTFTVIIFGALQFGVIGVLLAAPTFASSVLIVRYIWNKLWDRPGVPRITEDAEDPTLEWEALRANDIKAVLFTLDGTLTRFSTRLADRFLTPLGWILGGERWPTWRRREVLLHMQGDLAGFVARLYNLLIRLRVNDRRLQKILHPTLGLTAATNLQLHEDVLPALNRLQEEGLRLGLITIRPRSALETQLREAGLPLDVFDVVVTREQMSKLPPQRDGVRHALLGLELEPERIVLVSCLDVFLAPARTLGLSTVGVQREISSVRNLRQELRLLRTMTELPIRLLGRE